MGEKLDFKKSYRDLYLPGGSPSLIEVPPMRFIMVDGAGDPDGESYHRAVELLYALTFTIKMSKMGGNAPKGYFEYVVAPLEGLWDCGEGGFHPESRGSWRWVSMIRQPDFVTDAVFRDACAAAARKKPALDVSKARLAVYAEGTCVQVMHTGPYSDEPASIAKIDAFVAANGLKDMCGGEKHHHEIYLSDPRKAKPERLRTVLRHPVEKA